MQRFLTPLLGALFLAWLLARRLSSDALYAIATQAPVHQELPPRTAHRWLKIRSGSA